MFVTMPNFEQFIPPDLVPKNHKYWRAVSLSLEMHWYVFVYLAKYDSERIPQTTLVAWEGTLVDVLAGIPTSNRVAIGRMDKERGSRGSWQLRWLETVWAPVPDEVQETGELLFRFVGETVVRGTNLEPVGDAVGREVLFEAASSGAPEGPVIPEDFPQSGPEGAVPGAQPKVGAVLTEGRFAEASPGGRLERFEICQDLVHQVIAYAEHKHQEKPATPLAKLLDQVARQVETKRFGWGLSPAETSWLLGRVWAHFAERLGTGSSPAKASDPPES